MLNLHLQTQHPDDWREFALCDCCEVISRGTAPVYVERSNVFAIGQRCVREAGFDTSATRPHDERFLKGVLIAKSGDVLLNSTGTGTIGRSCVFNETGTYIVDGHITLMRPKSSKLDGRWLNILLKSFAGQRHLENYCYAGSTNQIELSKACLAASIFPIPLIEEQRRLADILDTADAAIRQTDALVAKLKQMKAGLMHDLLTRGLDLQGNLRDPEAHPEQFKDSEIGRVPKEWDVVGIVNFLQPHGGLKPGPFGSSITKSIYTSSGYRVYGQEQVIAGDLASGNYFISKTKYKELEIFAVQDKDILLSLVGTTGKVLVVRSPFHPGIINPRLVRLRPDQATTDVEFFKHLLVSPIIYQQMSRVAQGGTMDVLSGVVLRRLLLPKPKDKHEQERIASILDTQDARIRAEEANRDKLKAVKQGLMQDLLTGRVRVPDPDHTQP
jgi:type I restriction enzyme S subunit